MRSMIPRGAILVWAALLITVMLIFVSLVLNVGHLTSVKGQLQNASDAAALAAAVDIAKMADSTGEVTTAGMAAGTASAVALAGLHSTDVANTAAASSIAIPPSAVVYGQWATGTFTPTANRALINAVKVTTSRTAASGSALSTFMAPILGRTSGSTMDVGATSVAAVGSRCDLTCDGLFPIMIKVDDCNTATLCGMTDITVIDDSPFWTSFDTGKSAKVLSDIVRGSYCDPTVTPNPPSASVGECIDAVPGTKTSVLHTIVDSPYCDAARHAGACAASPTPAVIPVVCESGGCSNFIIGFVNITVRRVDDTGSPKSLTFDITCGGDNTGNASQAGTCRSLGNYLPRPVLVQ